MPEDQANLPMPFSPTSTSDAAPPDPPGSAPILDWSSLSHADSVDIYESGVLTASGRIDVLSSDGGILWLQADGADCRRLFLQRDVTVYKRLRGGVPQASR